jgi:GTP cyclohydrolase II
VSDPRAAARAIDALRRGWPIAVGGTAVLAIETADAGRLATFDPDAQADVLISAGRAATLKLANQLAAADPDAPVLVERAPWIDFDGATALADPQLDLATPLKGPYRAKPVKDVEGAAAALRLARMAGLLPAFFVGGRDPEVQVAPDDIAAHEDAARLAIATRARLPVDGAENAEIVAFR